MFKNSVPLAERYGTKVESGINNSKPKLVEIAILIEDLKAQEESLNRKMRGAGIIT